MEVCTSGAKSETMNLTELSLPVEAVIPCCNILILMFLIKKQNLFN